MGFILTCVSRTPSKKPTTKSGSTMMTNSVMITDSGLQVRGSTPFTKEHFLA
jgi:hypothetical protein